MNEIKTDKTCGKCKAWSQYFKKSLFGRCWAIANNDVTGEIQLEINGEVIDSYKTDNYTVFIETRRIFYCRLFDILNRG